MVVFTYINFETISHNLAKKEDSERSLTSATIWAKLGSVPEIWKGIFLAFLFADFKMPFYTNHTKELI